jgi:polyhydroxyalkanoate synthase
VAGGYPANAQGWLAGAARRQGSWWEDWAEWAGARAGALVRPPSIGSDQYPPVGDAPGNYVRG